MSEPKSSKSKGILNEDYFKENFHHQTFRPTEMLRNYIEHFWLISWQLPTGESYQQSVIPHPNVHVTFLKNNSHIQGIHLNKYTHTLQGKGNIIGIKFKPAGFYPFCHKVSIALRDITNQVVDIKDMFDIDTAEVEQHVLSLTQVDRKITYLENQLFNENIIYDKAVPLINEIVESIRHDKTIFKVSDICQKFDIEQRRLQRLFSIYVGISAKWIINRYRIHEALEELTLNRTIDWAAFAIELGYYDQAHFIKDFKGLIGQTPKAYLQMINHDKR